MRENSLAQLCALSRKWFPSTQIDEQSMAEALFLESDYWEKMEIAVCNGIARAFKG